MKSRNGKKWTKKEENILREGYNKISNEELSELLKRNIKSIREKASILKITKNNQWTDDDLKFLIKNYKNLDYKDIGKVIGKTRQAVNTKVWRLGLENKRDDWWSEAEKEWLISIYSSSSGKKDLNLDDVAKKMGREKSNICRKAKEMGLDTTYFRGLTKKQSSKLSKRFKDWHKNNEHPLGMLGKHQSEEFKRKQSIRLTGKKQNLTNEERKRRSERAKIRIRELMKNGNMYSRTKSGKRADLNGSFFRSAWEANYARTLNMEDIKWKYEPKEFIFKEEIKGVKTYIPDFYLVDSDEWIEVKGWLDSKSKSKLKKFKKYYPKEFKKLTVLIKDKPSPKKESYYSILQKMGITKFIFYDNLFKKYKTKIKNWE